MFPFLKDIEFEIMKSYWLVNLEVHPRSEPKNDSMQFTHDQKRKKNLTITKPEIIRSRTELDNTFKIYWTPPIGYSKRNTY